MFMSDVKYEELARRLRDAYATCAVESLGNELDPVDVNGAYAVQTINTRYWEAQGRRIVGRKIGLTRKAVQQQLGAKQPGFGVLFADMQIMDGGHLDPSRVLQPQAEAEIALVIGTDLSSPDTSVEEIAAAVKTVHAAIEIVDSRIADWKITLADTLADNGSSAFFVLGHQGKLLAGLDLETATMTMKIDGQVASTGIGAAVMGNPLNAAVWLARTLAGGGEPLKAGDILLLGSLGPMVALKTGQNVHAAIDGIGAVSFSYDKD